jgi:hypothetical protein
VKHITVNEKSLRFFIGTMTDTEKEKQKGYKFTGGVLSVPRGI